MNIGGWLLRDAHWMVVAATMLLLAMIRSSWPKRALKKDDGSYTFLALLCIVMAWLVLMWAIALLRPAP